MLRIAALAGAGVRDTVLEVGPGLGSLTLALLGTGAAVVAVEVDPLLAAQLPVTVAERCPGAALTAVCADALRWTPEADRLPGVLVANLPYNVAVPVLLHLLATQPRLERGLVMVQREVAERLTASPGSRVYGVPSVKAAWWAELRPAGGVPRSVFWPVPRVDSALVSFRRRPAPAAESLRGATFAAVDAAFATRRKMLRGSLAGWAGSATRAAELLRAADLDPAARGETLAVGDYARLAALAATIAR